MAQLQEPDTVRKSGKETNQVEAPESTTRPTVEQVHCAGHNAARFQKSNTTIMAMAIVSKEWSMRGWAKNGIRHTRMLRMLKPA